MGKPWAKYEVGFINHTKFKALNSHAICLWIEGKNFSDANFTDGLLPTYEVEHWKYYSKKALAMLTASCGPKSDGSDESFAPLWERHACGWKMHDYLEHNDCREEQLERIAAFDVRREAAREADRQRKAAMRAAKQEKAAGACPTRVRVVSGGVSGGVSADKSSDSPTDISNVRPLSASKQQAEYRIQKEEAGGSRSLPPAARSKRPIFTGQKLTVFEWMLDELEKLLTPYFVAFDVHEWFFALDARCVKDGIIPPERDNAAWLKAQTLAEAQRRGLRLHVGSSATDDAAAFVAEVQRQNRAVQ